MSNGTTLEPQNTSPDKITNDYRPLFKPNPALDEFYQFLIALRERRVCAVVFDEAQHLAKSSTDSEVAPPAPITIRKKNPSAL